MGQARVRSPAQRTLQRQAESGGFNLADLGHTLECRVWGEIRLTFCFSLSARLGLRSTVLNKMAPRGAIPPFGLGRCLGLNSTVCLGLKAARLGQSGTS